MTKKLYLFPLLMLSVATISLSACDDSSKEAEPAAVQESAIEAPVEAVVAEVMAPMITAMNATSFATAEGSATGAVFLTIENTSTENDRLIGASTPVSSVVEIHENVVDEATGVMQMRKVDGIEIAANGKAELKADGNHIMLMTLSAPLVEGTSFDVTLDFEKGADVVVPVTIVAAGTQAMDGDHSSHMTTPENTSTAPTEPSVTESVTEEIAPVIEEVTDPTSVPEIIEAPAVDEQPAQ